MFGLGWFIPATNAYTLTAITTIVLRETLSTAMYYLSILIFPQVGSWSRNTYGGRRLSVPQSLSRRNMFFFVSADQTRNAS